MARFNVTYARTTYLELAVEARDLADAERVAALMQESPGAVGHGRPLGRSLDRVVEITPALELMLVPRQAA